MLLVGVGASPIFSLGITYLDENVKQRYSSLYNGELNQMFFGERELSKLSKTLFNHLVQSSFGDCSNKKAAQSVQKS